MSVGVTNWGHRGYLRRGKTCGAADPGGQHLTLHPRAVKRGVLGFRPQREAVHQEGRVGVEQHQVGRRALGQPALRQAQPVGRVQRHGPEQRGRSQVAAVIKPHRGGQEGFQRHRARRRRLLEGQALRFLVGRGVQADEITSIAPSATAATIASRSSSDRRAA
jgi:hypothetical protein